MVEKQGAEFITAKVEQVDPESRTVFLDSGQTETYDVLSFNAGSYVPEGLVVEKSENLYPVKPIERLMEARQRVYDILTGEDQSRVCKDIPEAACSEQPHNFLTHVTSLAATKTADGLVATLPSKKLSDIAVDFNPGLDRGLLRGEH